MKRKILASLAGVALMISAIGGATPATAAPPPGASTQGAGTGAPVFWCLTFGYFCPPKAKCRDNWCR